MVRWTRFESLGTVALAALVSGGCDLGDVGDVDDGRAAVPAEIDDAPGASPEAVERVRALPLHFEKNLGQVDAAARYVSRAPGYNLFLTDAGAVMTIAGPRPRLERDQRRQRFQRRAPSAVVTMTLLGADAKAPFHGEGRLEGTTTYLKGTAAADRPVDVEDVGAVRRTDIYPGIDVVFYGNGRELEYDFVVAAGADPRQIRLQLAGADRLSLADNGDLNLHIGDRGIVQRAPVVYQEAGGRRQPIEGRYRIDGDIVTFELGAYDAGRPLVIDPILGYSTYLGGTGDDFPTWSTVDPAGNLYVVGGTTSADFPTPPNALQPDLAGGDLDAFVVKLDPSGKRMIYSTYLGGEGDDIAWAVTVDAAGRAIVAGETASLDFPIARANQPAHGGGYIDAFVAVLAPNGRALARSTYLGGGDDDAALVVQSDLLGNVYVVGNTYSTDFPVTAGALQTTNRGGSDAFVTKFDPAIRNVRYSTYYGGSDEDYALDTDVFLGDAFVSGNTRSADLPTTAGAFQSTLNGPVDAFVFRLDERGKKLQYATYFGGSNGETASHVQVRLGVAYVSGHTSSPDFPVRPDAFQRTFGGGQYDGFIFAFGPHGNRLMSTFFGGSGVDRVGGIAVDSGMISFVGRTTSPNLRVTAGALQSAAQGDYDAFVGRLRLADQKLMYSTYLGGSGADQSYGQPLSLDAQGSVYFVGDTDSTNFPVTPGSLQPASAGGLEGFVTKLKF